MDAAIHYFVEYYLLSLRDTAGDTAGIEEMSR